MTPPRIYVSAGEPSGDMHGAALARALRRVLGTVRLDGMGGERMAAAGVDIAYRSDRLSARGLIEAAGALPAHVRVLRELRRRFDRTPYDLVVVIDYPGFHLRAAAAAQRAGIPVLYYIAPQLWAWGAWRHRRLRAVTDRLAVVLPFEEPYFTARGLPARFVGHPLVDRARPPEREAARTTLHLPARGPVLGLFPGSRTQEIARHWPPFRDAARHARRAIPELEVVVAAVSGARYADSGDFTLHVGDAGLALSAADACICKSGTTTLDAALHDTPHIVAYRTHPITFAAARRLVRVPWIGLVNLIVGRAVLPELIQTAATPTRLAECVLPLLDPGGGPARSQRAAFAEVRARLGPPGATQRVAVLAAELAA